MSHHHHPHHHHHGSLIGGLNVTRRATIGGMGAALALAHLKPARAAVPFPQRLVIVNVLGGLDGLAAVVPYGDPNLAGLRSPLVPPAVGQPGGMFDLGGFYGLNPAMPTLYNMFQAGQMLAVHAVGGIVNTRSHFAGQTALQTGETAISSSGWMNRLTSVLATQPGGVEPGVALTPSMPTFLQGPVQAASWCSSSIASTPNTLAALVETLGSPDPLIGGPIESGFNDKTLLQSFLAGRAATSSALQQAMQAAGLFLSSPGGPAVAIVQTDTMDTHINQNSRLSSLLSDLDASIGVLASAMGSAWANTVVMTVTEFGRAAYMNGCGGTDHGTGFAMFLAGGPVAGGQVVSDWPTLAANQLLDNRDLAPTVDIRSVIMGVLQDHLGLTPSQLATVFPNAGVSPLDGLIQSEAGQSRRHGYKARL